MGNEVLPTGAKGGSPQGDAVGGSCRQDILTRGPHGYAFLSNQQSTGLFQGCQYCLSRQRDDLIEFDHLGRDPIPGQAFCHLQDTARQGAEGDQGDVRALPQDTGRFLAVAWL